MKTMNMVKSTAMFLAVLAISMQATAQDGLAGELDDLLGLGDDGAGEVVAADKAKENVEAAAEEVKADAEEVKADAAANVEAVVEEIKAEAEEIKAAAEEVKAEVEEVKADAEEVKAAAEEVKAEVEEAKADVEEVKADAEEVKAAAEEVKAEVEEAKADAEVKVEAAAEEVKAAADDDLADLLKPDPVAEPKPEVAVPDEVKAEPVVKAEEAATAEVAEVVEEETPVEVKAEPVDAPLNVAEPVEETPVAIVADSAEQTEVTDDIKAEISEIATLERMRRQALEKHGRSSIEAARAEMKEGNYVEALRLYEETKKYLPNRPGNEALIDEAEQGIAEATYLHAKDLWKKDVYEEALQWARRAREHDHPKASQLIKDIEDEIANPPKPPRPKEVKRWHEASYKDNAEEVNRRLGKAREYYITGEYDLARRELEIILKNNPYNRDALAMLKKVAQRDYDFASEEFNTTRATMVQEVRDKWTPDRYAIDVDNLAAAGDPNNTTGSVITDKSGKTPEETIVEKMTNIVIPEINFRAANINDVILFFQEASREYDDPQIPPNQRGVNIILKLGQQAAPAEEIASDDPFAAAETPASTGGVPPVSFSGRYMNLYEALKIITEISGLKFRVRGNIVMVLPVNEADVDMVSRTYTVLPSIEERASSISSALTAGKADSGSFLDPTDVGSDSASGGVDWKQLFSDMGVKWPNGSTITYLPSINKMRVLNTPENLVEFEKALQELNVTPRQVEIEARFVEVGQSDLDSLGIEWGLTDPWEIARNKNDPQQYIQISKATTGNPITRTLKNADTAFASMNPVDDSLLTVASHLTNPEVEMVLHAISQKSNTDLLSAPKVVTMNSQEAIIKVVKEFIYPTDYEVKDQSTSNGDSDNVQNTYPMVQPSEFEMREVGVVLQVVPEVSEDGEMIYLQLSPQIISEPEFEDYGFDYPKGVLSASGEMETYHLTMKQPIFKVRSINTKVAIYNGSTVVMGGMITEERVEVEDKIPFLGDLPLIGRLFRTKYEQSDKRNLLIFVTARMVDPAGRTVKSESNTPVSVH